MIHKHLCTNMQGGKKGVCSIAPHFHVHMPHTLVCGQAGSVALCMIVSAWIIRRKRIRIRIITAAIGGGGGGGGRGLMLSVFTFSLFLFLSSSADVKSILAGAIEFWVLHLHFMSELNWRVSHKLCLVFVFVFALRLMRLVAEINRSALA